jgi:hypothetical protein
MAKTDKLLLENTYFDLNVLSMKKWFIYSVASLSTVGFGLALLGEAIIAKFKEESWFLMGTLALVVINSGLSLLGRAVMERLKEYK